MTKDIKDIEKDILEIKLRLGKMRIQDIADELGLDLLDARKYRKEILCKLDVKYRVAVLEQETYIELLRKKILTGEMKKRPHNHSVGVEGLVRGIIRDLVKEGKSISQIKVQTGFENSTISYHKRNIKNKNRRRYPPRIMNMLDFKIKKKRVKGLLKEGKNQTQIREILNIASGTISTIVQKIIKDNEK